MTLTPTASPALVDAERRVPQLRQAHGRRLALDGAALGGQGLHHEGVLGLVDVLVESVPRPVGTRRRLASERRSAHLYMQRRVAGDGRPLHLSPGSNW